MSYNKPISNYAEKLRDPRWQKKRLEIMQRDNFTCVNCDEKEKTLNVHHCFYEYGNDPWNYPNESLITLCELCHENEECERGSEKSFVRTLQKIGFTYSDFGFVDFYLNKAIDIGTSKRDIQKIFGCFIKLAENHHSVGGKTNSAEEEKAPTGEGSCAGGTVERKSDA